MADIVLINPPLSRQERYGNIAEGGAFEPPLGLCYIASIVRDKGMDVKIIDAEVLRLSYEDTAQLTIDFSPKYIGFTATTLSISIAATVASLIKKQNKEKLIIIGGPHVTAVPKETMIRYQSFDVAVIGEGEQTIVELLNAIEQKKDLENIPGIGFRREQEIVITSPRSFIKNLDNLPLPAWDLLPYLPSHYKIPPQSLRKSPSISLITSRGCPHRCIFCDKRVFGNKYRFHSPEYMMEMIKDLYYNYNIRNIHFEDDVFLISKIRVEKFSHLLKREKLNLLWSCLTHINTCQERILKMIKEAGCWQILFGIESGSQRILDILKKDITLDQIQKSLGIAKKVGLKTKVFIMFGNPRETKETLIETINFLQQPLINDFSSTFFTPFPGSEVYTKVNDFGVFKEDWGKMSLYEPVFIPYGLTAQDLEHYSKAAYRLFYLRLSKYFEYLLRMRHPRQLWGSIKGALGLLSYLVKVEQKRCIKISSR